MEAEVKIFEIRDEATCMIAVTWLVRSHNEQERWALCSRGFGRTGSYGSGVHCMCGDVPYMLTYIPELNQCDYSPERLFGGEQRYVKTIEWIRDHFDELEGGSVVDVRCVNGERDRPARSDRFFYLDEEASDDEV